MVSPVYKVGVWLKDRQGSQLYEIVEERWYNGGELLAYVIKRYTEPRYKREYYPCELTDKFEIAPLARLLYSNKVTTNQGE